MVSPLRGPSTDDKSQMKLMMIVCSSIVHYTVSCRQAADRRSPDPGCCCAGCHPFYVLRMRSRDTPSRGEGKVGKTEANMRRFHDCGETFSLSCTNMGTDWLWHGCLGPTRMPFSPDTAVLGFGVLCTGLFPRNATKQMANIECLAAW